MDGSSSGKIVLLAAIGGPVGNLVLVSGAMSLVMILLDVELLVMGMAIFGLYSLGLSLIYLVMRPALEAMEATRLFQAAMVVVTIAFLSFTLTFLLDMEILNW